MKRALRGGIIGVVWLVACASAPAGEARGPDEIVEITQKELDRLKAAEAEAAALRTKLAELERQLAETRATLLVAEQRLGRAPFAPRTLSRGGFRLKFPDAAKLDAQFAKGKKTNLAKALAGTRGGAILAYWATWCKPCTAPDELERMRTLKGELAAHGVELIFYTVDDDLAIVTGDPRAGTWLYPLWQRDNGHLEMLPESFVRSQGVDLPLLLVLTPAGDVTWVRKGALDDEALRDLVTAGIRQTLGL